MFTTVVLSDIWARGLACFLGSALAVSASFSGEVGRWGTLRVWSENRVWLGDVADELGDITEPCDFDEEGMDTGIPLAWKNFGSEIVALVGVELVFDSPFVLLVCRLPT